MLSVYMNNWVREWPASKEWQFEGFLWKVERERKKKLANQGLLEGKMSAGCCTYCRKQFSTNVLRTTDHLIPLAHGGTNDKSNLVDACFNCNQWKADKSLRHWLRDLRMMQKMQMEGWYYNKLTVATMISRLERIISKQRFKNGAKAAA